MSCLERERAARHVRVLEPQDERAADVPGVQVVEQRRPGGPDVQRAGRARRDPDADGRRGRRSITRVSGRRGRDRVEQRRVGVAGQDADERRRPEAERGPAARPVEGQRVERLGAGEDRDVGARLSARASRYDSRPASSSASSVIR